MQLCFATDVRIELQSTFMYGKIWSIAHEYKVTKKSNLMEKTVILCTVPLSLLVASGQSARWCCLFHLQPVALMFWSIDLVLALSASSCDSDVIWYDDSPDHHGASWYPSSLTWPTACCGTVDVNHHPVGNPKGKV
jgi:hypothetical protein